MEPPTVTKVLNRMEKTGLVKRIDSTPLTVSLTSRGIRLRKQVESCWLQVRIQMLEDFTAEEQIILQEAFEGIEGQY